MASTGTKFWRKAIILVACAVVVTSAVYRDTVCHNEHEIACRNEQCIPSARECDGQIDCSDGSDETLLRCKNAVGRPIWPIVFHCSVGWTRDLYDGVCPDICKHKPDFCSYAVLAENGAPNTCKLPPYPDHGDYHVADYSRTDTFSLYYGCNANYDLDGPNYPRCERGIWLNKHPKCQLVAGSSGVDEEDIRK